MDQTIRLDAKKRESSFCEEKIYPMRRGERNNVVLTVQVRADGAPYDLTGKEARLVGTAADGKLVGPCPLEISDEKAGTGSLTLPASMCSAVGTTHAYIEVREGEAIVETTDSFACKVLECADMDAEQAEEAAPLIVELRDAVASAKRAAEGADAAASHQPRIGGAGTWETWDAAAGAYADTGVSAQGPKGDTGPQGAQGVKGDPFTYNDFTESQIAELQRPATEAAADAKAAIAEVKATEAKLYPAAENILVGSDSGAVAHVEDAFLGASLRKITIEGACKQDGTPSPDNPVPIEVVEHPVVKVTGRNLVDNKYPTYIAAYNNGIAIVNKYSYNNPSAVLPFTTGPRSSDGFGFIEKLKPNVTYTLKGFNAPDKSVVCIAGYKNVEDIANARSAIWHIRETSLKSPVQFTVKEGGEYVTFSFAAIWGDGNNKITYPAEFKATVECGSTATEYKPYTSQSLTFTLPAEHPYLAKLPDGTADEIVVDRNGNVKLVARVNKIIFNGSQRFQIMDFDGIDTYYETTSFIGNGILPAKQWGGIYDRFVTDNPYTLHSGACAYSFANVDGTKFRIRPSETFDSVYGFINWLKSNPVTSYYADTEPKTYNLGKIALPALPESVSNAWTDAEVTPNTSIEYVRDVNIVVANLEAAIASITEG